MRTHASNGNSGGGGVAMSAWSMWPYGNPNARLFLEPQLSSRLHPKSLSMALWSKIALPFSSSHQCRAFFYQLSYTATPCFNQFLTQFCERCRALPVAMGCLKKQKIDAC